MADDLKSTLRREVCARLKAMEEGERLTKSQRAWVRMISSDEYRRAKTVAAYASFGTEFPTRALLETVLRDGKTLGLPRINKQDCSMKFHAITNLDRDLETNALGFNEPKSERPVIDAALIDLLIVPGIGFDTKLNRLGRGAGFYDRYLAGLAPNTAVCALAFECQIVDNVPVFAHDRKVQAVFTEDRSIR
jgi:5-formyltetrahydrofolate cyclo-ligase